MLGDKTAQIVIGAMGLIVGVIGILSAAAFLGYMEGRSFEKREATGSTTLRYG